jgi:hypothetical protein
VWLGRAIDLSLVAPGRVLDCCAARPVGDGCALGLERIASRIRLSVPTNRANALLLGLSGDSTNPCEARTPALRLRRVSKSYRSRPRSLGCCQSLGAVNARQALASRRAAGLSGSADVGSFCDAAADHCPAPHPRRRTRSRRLSGPLLRSKRPGRPVLVLRCGCFPASQQRHQHSPEIHACTCTPGSCESSRHSRWAPALGLAAATLQRRSTAKAGRLIGKHWHAIG